MNSEFKLGDEGFSKYSEKHERIPSNFVGNTEKDRKKGKTENSLAGL